MPATAWVCAVRRRAKAADLTATAITRRAAAVDRFSAGTDAVVQRPSACAGAPNRPNASTQASATPYRVVQTGKLPAVGTTLPPVACDVEHGRECAADVRPAPSGRPSFRAPLPLRGPAIRRSGPAGATAAPIPWPTPARCRQRATQHCKCLIALWISWSPHTCTGKLCGSTLPARARCARHERQAFHQDPRLPDERVRLGQDGRRARGLARPGADRQRRAEADVILVNTCSIREKAQEKVFSQLGRWKALKQGDKPVAHRRRRLRGLARKARRSSSARRTSIWCSARRPCIACPR